MRPRSYYAICAIGLLFLIGGEAPAREKTSEAKLPLHDRVWIAAQIYSAINVYFGHWRGVPELNLDREFQSYLDEIMATDDRRSFDLASMQLIAKLMNGHTGFRDRWLTDNYGQSLGFYAYSVGGPWVVTQSMVDELKPGDVISRINDQSSEDFFGSVRKYISASNERSARRFLFEYPYLFPASFSLVLKDGRDVRVTRKGWPEEEHFELTVRENNGTLYLRIPSFADPKLEEAAVRAVQEFSNSKAIVVDVRGNHGGSSPETLIGKLMNQRYRWWTQSTSVDFGLLKFQGIFGEHSDVFSYGGSSEPDKSAYQGAVFILVDGGCFSACEDFLIPFQDNHRAVILGSPTGGSTGQPVTIEFGNGMLLSLGARRVSFPDGSEFEGVGIKPDFEIDMTVQDLRTGNDPVLDKANTLIREFEDRKE